MISSLRGTVLGYADGRLIIETGGVGFSVNVPVNLGLLSKVGEEAFIYTHLVVREDAMTLYGFGSESEQKLFLVLTGVSGVGPRIALALIGQLSVTEIATAVATENDAVFRSVPGIGPKLAKLIVVSLSGKLDTVAISASTHGISKDIIEQLVQALTGLGYPATAAEKVAKDVALENPKAEIGVLLKSALTELAAK
ncbi:MAG: Holliday junction branch migration protein RuvA [Microbacteriaceae bacterium]|nr:Holliday junction branch migration protein RuvA [Microbacteriaceae bacterium]